MAGYITDITKYINKNTEKKSKKANAAVPGSITDISQYAGSKKQQQFARYAEIAQRVGELGQNLGLAADENGNSLFLESLQNEDAARLLDKMRAQHASEYAEYERLLDELDALGDELWIDDMIEQYEASQDYVEDLKKAGVYMESLERGEDPEEPQYSAAYYAMRAVLQGK